MGVTENGLYGGFKCTVNENSTLTCLQIAALSGMAEELRADTTGNKFVRNMHAAFPTISVRIVTTLENKLRQIIRTKYRTEPTDEDGDI
jgi:hypothetical protein